MSEKDIRVSPLPQNNIVNKPAEYQTTRARAYSIRSSVQNYKAFVDTIKAYKLAGMDFQDIAEAGVELGEEVAVNEVDAPIQPGWQNQEGEVIEEQGKFMTWQYRSETVSSSVQISSSQRSSITKMEIVSASSHLAPVNVGQTIPVVEGIHVTTQDSSSHDAQIESSPFLRPLDKAA